MLYYSKSIVRIVKSSSGLVEILLLFLIFIFQLGCYSNSTKKSTIQTKDEEKTLMQTTSDQEQNFKIMISEGGGITGLYKGYTVYSDGKVEHWQRMAAKNISIIWVVHQDPKRILELKQQLEKSGAFKKAYRARGNMTTAVTYQLSDTSYTWSWKGIGKLHNIPPELKDWYESIKQFCISASPKK